MSNSTKNGQVKASNVNPDAVALPSMMDGNLAMRILSNPATSMDAGHTIPRWSQLDEHLMGLKFRACEIARNAGQVFDEIWKAGYGNKESKVLYDRLLIETQTVVTAINEISLRYPADYRGPARTPQESQDILLFSTEATENFHKYTTTITLTVQRLQEIHTLVTLTARRRANEALAAAQAAGI